MTDTPDAASDVDLALSAPSRRVRYVYEDPVQLVRSARKFRMARARRLARLAAENSANEKTDP